MKRAQKVTHAICIPLLGILLGVFSKWLDLLPINDAIPWQRLIGRLDLRNIFSELPIWALLATVLAVFAPTPKRAAGHVFLFFAGMTVSYHLYSIYAGGFNSLRYMLLWYGITLLSPLPAYICWHAKAGGKPALLIRVLIIAFLMYFAFAVGPGYLDVSRAANVLFCVVALGVLWHGWKDAATTALLAFALRVLLGFAPHW